MKAKLDSSRNISQRREIRHLMEVLELKQIKVLQQEITIILEIQSILSRRFLYQEHTHLLVGTNSSQLIDNSLWFHKESSRIKIKSRLNPRVP